jgi:diacylglycerol kinase (ATP)
MACGFDALVNERANAMTFPPGRAKYVSAMLAELRIFRPQVFTLDLDDQVVIGPMMLVAVGNAASYGGGMRVCPDAELDDGLLDVTVVHEISRPEFMKVFPSVYAGTHVHHPAVETFRARRVSLAAEGALAYADGERIGPLPQTVEAIPAAVRLIGRAVA